MQIKRSRAENTCSTKTSDFKAGSQCVVGGHDNPVPHTVHTSACSGHISFRTFASFDWAKYKSHRY
jgi:hypothetical protein